MSQLTRKLFIGGNWKCNNTLQQTQNLMKNTINKILYDPTKMDILIAPTYMHLHEVHKLLEDPTIQLAAQNISQYSFGAYTGETCAQHLHDFNTNWTLLGHSERRHLFNEDDTLVAEKTKFAIDSAIEVVLCIGETLDQRKSNQVNKIIKKQLDSVRETVKQNEPWQSMVIAYEPVWAIGTGEVATPDQAQEVHQYIREWIGENIDTECQERTRIIYGGSVNEKNCEQLIREKDIDGFLIGGAALKDSFKKIIDIISETHQLNNDQRFKFKETIKQKFILEIK